MEVSVDRASILCGAGKQVGPVLSPLGRKEGRWQLQVTQTSSLPASDPQRFSRTWRVVVRDVSRFYLWIGSDPYLPRVAGLW